MRLWSIHPKYLDPQGLVALWREGLLAQKVLAGKTRGYTQHPQLQRFKVQADPMNAIGIYLWHVQLEARKRGYSFNQKKILQCSAFKVKIPVSRGQKHYEFKHLKMKLKTRSPLFFAKIKGLDRISLHPLFSLTSGGVEDWERISS